MLGIKIRRHKKTELAHTYYKCARCGYISLVKSESCPICIKDGFTIKMK